MSELLRLREWLGFAEAQRYMSLLGIKAPKKDFFIAYASADMPMQLVCRTMPLYTLGRELPEAGYPHLLNIRHERDNTYETDAGTVYPVDSDLKFAASKRQTGYRENSVVWVNEPPWMNIDPPGVEPVYYYWEYEGHQRFEILTWGDLLREQAEGALQFSRPHIETLVKRAKGEEAPDPVKPEPAAPAPAAPQVPPYLDPSHESYPPELAAAVMLWEALYVRGEKNQHHGHTQAAKLWLKKNGDSLPTAHLSNHRSDQWFSRLQTITNPEAKKPKR